MFLFFYEPQYIGYNAFTNHTIINFITSVKIPEEKKINFYLGQNYPNPFNPVTKIKYTIPKAEKVSHIRLKVYDILGNEIALLVNEEQGPGNYEIIFSGKDIPSGVYFYTLSSENYIKTKKMVFLK
jgi:hypothetical protein